VGNVRNPVGPLPSSIYWRRRAIVACLFAIVLAAAAWALTHGGGGHRSGGSSARGSGGHSRTPLPSITPGPTTSQTGITSMPGGRSTGGSSDGGDDGGTDAGAGGGTPGGSGGTAGSGGTGGGQQLAAGSSVPDCGGSRVRLVVRSVKSSYKPGEEPKFDISAVNSGGSACKVNFSPVSAVVTVLNSADHHVWASDDCPASRSPYLLEVQADSTTTHTVHWDLAVSSSQCATPPGNRTASAGTYQAEVAVPGLGSAQTTFALGKD
jgi:hypothetical protein